MIACLRPLSALCLAGLLAACAGSPSSSLGELPRTPLASIDQLLQQDSQSASEQAALLRLSAADQAWRQQDIGRATRILDEVSLDGLKPAQQVFAATLDADTMADQLRGMLDARANHNTDAARIADRSALKRWGEVDDLIGATVFLCSPAAAFVTGVTLAVDGGYHSG